MAISRVLTLMTILSVASASTFLGGFGLSENGQCPVGSIVCDSTNTEGCCPTNTVCRSVDSGNALLCCPTGQDCTATVSAAPVCANSTWILYGGHAASLGYLFCCQPGELALDSTANGVAGQCLPAGASLPSQSAATPYASITATSAGQASPTSKGKSDGTKAVPGAEGVIVSLGGVLAGVLMLL